MQWGEAGGQRRNASTRECETECGLRRKGERGVGWVGLSSSLGLG